MRANTVSGRFSTAAISSVTVSLKPRLLVFVITSPLVRAGSAAAALPRNPEDVPAGVLVGGAGQDEQEVREPVEVGEGLRGDGLGVREGHRGALGAAADGAGVVQGGGGGGAGGEDEAREVREGLVDPVAERLEARHLGRVDPQAA